MAFLKNPDTPISEKSRKLRSRTAATRKTHDDPTRITLAYLAGEVTQEGESTGEFDIRAFSAARGISRRRLYDVVDIMEAEGLLEWVPEKRAYLWRGLEGMRAACRAYLTENNPKPLLINMLNPTRGTGVSSLSIATQFLACFYVFGYFKCAHPIKRGQLIERIKEYIGKFGLENTLGRTVRDHKREKNIFRRVYDVVNVFVATEFYACADAVLNEECDKSAPIQYDRVSSGSDNTSKEDAKPPALVYTTWYHGKSDAGISHGPRFTPPAPVNDDEEEEEYISGCSNSRDGSDDILMSALLGSHADNFVYASAQLTEQELLFGFGNTIPYAEEVLL